MKNQNRHTTTDNPNQKYCYIWIDKNGFNASASFILGSQDEKKVNEETPKKYQKIRVIVE